MTGFCIPRSEDPVANKGTKLRVIGPVEKNGMRTWRIHTLDRVGKTGKAITPDLFSVDEVNSELKALISGKRSFWFGRIAFEEHAL